jgi:hypothetical protein
MTPEAMAQLAHANFTKQNFADISYSAPTYLKEFYTPSKP